MLILYVFLFFWRFLGAILGLIIFGLPKDKPDFPGWWMCLFDLGYWDKRTG